MGYTFSYVAVVVASPQQLQQQRAHQHTARRQDHALRVPELRARAVVRQLLVLHHLVRMVRILFCQIENHVSSRARRSSRYRIEESNK